MPMKKIITGIVAVLAISSFSVAVPAQNAVNAHKAHVEGIIDGLCTLYPDWCFN